MLQRAGRIGVSTAIHRLSPAVPLVMAVALAGIIQLGLCQLLCGAWVSADAAAAAAVHFYCILTSPFCGLQLRLNWTGPLSHAAVHVQAGSARKLIKKRVLAVWRAGAPTGLCASAGAGCISTHGLPAGAPAGAQTHVLLAYTFPAP